jgi:predicted TIM-barrel fold metal-dependent hydrolase
MYTGPIIDTDVHHNWSSEKELLPYLPEYWRDFVTKRPHGRYSLTMAPTGGISGYVHTNGLPYRIETIGGTGVPASDYNLVKEQLLDAYNMDRVIVGFDIGKNAGLQNPELATEVCRAANQWCIDKWLSLPDDRIRGVIMAPTQDIEASVAEIKRAGKHDKMCAVLVVQNGMNKPFGHPVYWPIYEAAIEMGLPIQIHAGGDGIAGGGPAASRMEWHTLGPLPKMAHLSSFISFGTLERYKDLHILGVESGVAWTAWLLYNLDARYQELKRESPSLRKLPSEYFREHIKLSTQPLEDGERNEQLVDVLSSFEGIEDVLCFSTDYPHWDADDPMYVSRVLPKQWLPKIMWGNAQELYGWGRPFAGHSREEVVGAA